MAHGYRPQLPSIIPDGIVTVEREQHTYETFEGSSNTVLPKYEYTLRKAPVVEIEEVTGVSGGDATTFSEGSDYVLSDLVSDREDSFTFSEDTAQYTLTTVPDIGSVTITDASGDTYTDGVDFAVVESAIGDKNVIDWSAVDGDTPDDGEDFNASYEVTYQKSVIDWDQGGDTPDAGSFFYVTYRAYSIISRFLDVGDEEFKRVEDELDAIIEAKFLGTETNPKATGEELDRIGEVFGELGKRRGRTDTQYRIYLKSVVQSFVSRGTVSGIKTAISAATDVPIEDITINEDFQNNEYEVQILAATPITGSLLEEVSDIADPSGVEQSRTRLVLPPEEIELQDGVNISQGELVEDDMGADDVAAIFNEGVFEDLTVDDAFAIDPNKFTAADQMSVDDAFAIDPNKFTTADDLGIADAAASTRGSAAEDVSIADNIQDLDVQDKDQFRWETDDDPARDTEWNFFQWTELQDLVETIGEDVGSADVVSLDPNTTTAGDDMGSADANAIDANKQTVADVASADDAVNIIFNGTKVAEDTGTQESVTATTASVAWGTNWNSFNWGGAVEDAFE